MTRRPRLRFGLVWFRAGGGLAIVLLLIAASTAAAQSEPKIDVQISSPRIYFGQTIGYQVKISNAKDASRPQLDVSEDFDVTYRGAKRIGFHQVIVNGRVIRDVRGGVTHVFELKPRKTGWLEIPPPRVTIAGRTFTGPARTVEVLPPEAQDVVWMQTRAERQTVYPMQPFTVTLSVAVKGLPEPYESRNPMQVQNQPPMLRIPWVDDDAPQGLEPKVAWSDWLQPLMNRTGEGGFNINGLATRSTSLFDFFSSTRSVAFAPTPRRITRKTADGTNADYWLYEFKQTFVSKTVRRYTFGPVSVEGTFANRLSAQERLLGEPIYAVAEAIEVTVRDVPLEGRPDSYTGAVGTFQLAAELEPRERKVGDPMTLTLKLTGQGTLDQTRPPDLERIPQVADYFKVYEATAQVKGDSCRFTYALRPKEAGIEEFPPIPLSYFDVQTERYVTLKTDPIPVRITEADRLLGDQIVAAQRNLPGTGNELETRREGIFANVTDPSAVGDERARPVRWLITLAGMVGFYVVAALAVGQVRRVTGDLGLTRRRSAPQRARKRVQEGAAELHEDRIREGCDLVYSSLVGLVGDVANLPDAGMTPKDVDAQLEEFDLDADLRGRVGRLLETCDAARYGSPGESGQLGHEAAALVEEVIAALKTGRRFR